MKPMRCLSQPLLPCLLNALWDQYGSVVHNLNEFMQAVFDEREHNSQVIRQKVCVSYAKLNMTVYIIDNVNVCTATV